MSNNRQETRNLLINSEFLPNFINKPKYHIFEMDKLNLGRIVPKFYISEMSISTTNSVSKYCIKFQHEFRNSKFWSKLNLKLIFKFRPKFGISEFWLKFINGRIWADFFWQSAESRPNFDIADLPHFD